MVNRDGLAAGADVAMAGMGTKEVLSILKFGAHAALNASAGAAAISREEVMEIIDRERSLQQKTSSLLTKETQQNAADFDAEVPFTAIRQVCRRTTPSN